MKQPFTKELLGNPLILGSVGIVVVIALGSAAYYFISSRSPASYWQTPTMGPIEEVVTGSGSVEPAENPDLAFLSGGRVASVSVTVGQTVSQGQVLASLDNSILSAQRAQAEANLKAAQAKLDEMQAPPRQTDISAKQTAVLQANQTLSDAYANIPSTIENAYGTSYATVHTDTDTLFYNNPANPTLIFQTVTNQNSNNANLARSSINGTLTLWQSQAGALSSASSPSDLETALTSSIANAVAVRTFGDTMLQALNDAVLSSSFSQNSVSAGEASVGSMRDGAAGLITTLENAQQQIASDKLAVQSAQDALNQINAGATPQDIEAQEAAVEAAQANVDSINAQIGNAVIIAPFSGTVSSVGVKVGQIVNANTDAISLTPKSGLQVEVYVTEVDAAKLKVGDAADVTLDAYGSGQHFPASVASVDTAPTMQNGTPAYKVTLAFSQDDAAIAIGMNANVTIIAAQKDTALLIPKSAVIQNGDEDFVLVPGPNGGQTERQVTLGVEGTSSVEVLSGLLPTDQFLSSTQ